MENTSSEKKQGKVIGLSLSRCIRDIIDEKVKEQDVDKIIARTAAKNEDDWFALIEYYTKKYWDNNPKAVAICNRLLEAGKIIQPKMENQEHPGLKGGIWIKAD